MEKFKMAKESKRNARFAGGSTPRAHAAFDSAKFDEGKMYMHRGEFSQAAAAFSELLKADPGNDQMRFMLKMASDRLDSNEDLNRIQYRLEIKTADAVAGGAGNDDMSIEFMGSECSTPPIKLKLMKGFPKAPSDGSGDPSNPFTSGSCHAKMRFQCPDLGQLLRIVIHYENGSYFLPGWYLETVTVVGESKINNNHRWVFAIMDRINSTAAFDVSHEGRAMPPGMGV
jgi:hypothetical protein